MAEGSDEGYLILQDIAMKLVLIDGFSIIHRAFYGLPNLTDVKGRYTGAVYGFVTMLFPMIEAERPDALVVALDSHGPTFRHEMYGEYKGTRKPMPDELRQQIPLFHDLLDAMKIPYVEKPGYEGDDILGTLARQGEKAGYDVTIVSGDRDTLQLATEKTKIYLPKTKGGKTTVEEYYAADVKDAYGVTPDEFIDVKALQGDTADNIPGVPKIGEKTAAALIQKYHTIENVHEHAAEVKPPVAGKNIVEYWDQAVLSKKLATIDRFAPVTLDTSADVNGLHNIFTPEAETFFREHDFRRLMKYFDGAAAPAGAEEVSLEKKTTFSPQEVEAEADRLLSEGQTLGLSLLVDEKTFYGLSLSDGNAAFFVPASEAFGETEAAAMVRRVFAGGGRVACDDLKAVYHLAQAEGERPFEGAEDVAVMAYILDPLEKSYAYDILAKKYLDESFPSLDEIKGKSRGKAYLADKSMAEQLACGQAAVSCRLLPVLEGLLKKASMDKIYTEIERPLIYTLYRMEREGVICDEGVLKTYGEGLTQAIVRLEKAVYLQAGEEFNINSPKQLGTILFEKLSLPGGKKTKTGYSTAADVLEKLAPEAPIVQNILDYRQYTKLKSTYAEGLLSCIADDGRIHTTFQQTVTATGRLSSTEPNLQNIPIRIELGREIRKAFLPREGWTFIDADYSQIELRVLAHMSGDENLIDAYLSDTDIHRATAARVFHKDLSEVTDLDRRRAKAVNFGIVYGISSFGLGENLGISRKEAEQYISDYYAAYPTLKLYLDGLVEAAKERGYSETLFGRRRPIPELKDRNYMTRSFGERVAMNAPIQGTAADIMKIAMNGIRQAFDAKGLSSRLLLQVHDEVLIETAPGEEEAVKQVLIDEMQGAVELAVPLVIDIESGKNWYDAK